MIKSILINLTILSTTLYLVSADSCDTYVHPTYGKGVCVDMAMCPNALYISGLCESQPANVRCCFSLGGSVSTINCATPTTKLSHSTSMGHLSSNGITVSSSGGCSDRNTPTCTSLDQVNCRTIAEIIAYKKSSGCAVVITGTETGHASGTQSHWTGYKLDIGLSTCNNNHVTTKFTYIGLRGDGAKLYKDARGNTWALEGNHWDILFP